MSAPLSTCRGVIIAKTALSAFEKWPSNSAFSSSVKLSRNTLLSNNRTKPEGRPIKSCAANSKMLLPNNATILTPLSLYHLAQRFRMSEEKLGFVGKQVKDIYGTYIGKVVGIITEIDGEIETVGVDCGSGGLKQLPYEQLVIQGDYVFFIPKWRLDAQRLLRQKSLTLKRIKALQDIVAENDSMKEDAELVSLKYEKKLLEIEGGEKQVDD